MDPQQAYAELIRRTWEARVLGSCAELLGWDERTYMPPQAQQAWQEARRASSFAAFETWLEKIVALKREEAAAVGYQGVPYDALLDEYEPGATTAEVTRVFADLQAELAPLVAAIAESRR